MKQIFSLSMLGLLMAVGLNSALNVAAWADYHNHGNYSHRYYNNGHGYSGRGYNDRWRNHEGHSYVRMPYYKHPQHHWWDR